MQEDKKMKVKKGFLAVQVGLEDDDEGGSSPQRFVIPISYLYHPLFKRLLDKAREVYVRFTATTPMAHSSSRAPSTISSISGGESRKSPLLTKTTITRATIAFHTLCTSTLVRGCDPSFSFSLLFSVCLCVDSSAN
ncbi:hypothetical protein glysoja_012853 [Glycine soja]|nr:hypothetical protein glysoja_012853 [Glycine soja]